ncbi:glycosyltransferase family 4 protein [Parvularcula maris]|uniref:Glycosyltransferase family 4 protein n=1 Tax=Parvularcula maris TaxID=2965077 RepID=A0A9X2L7G5_9PROT|nr:glycosyltransferase family 4 protein [Parvularcula maris]MCQ8184452.1 glycosyltransferase family 4 protein [Parvularcula maris]
MAITSSRSALKVALVSPLIQRTPPPLSGGTERVVHDLGEALVRKRHKVTLFAAEGSETSGDLITAGPPVAEVEDHPPGYPAAREAQLLDLVRQQAERFDVIHCHTEFMHAPVLAEHRSKTLTTVHWRTDEMDRQHFFRAFPDLPAASISLAQARSLPPEALHLGTVHHGMPKDRYEPGSGGGGYVAFLGRLTDQKGPDRAILAARRAGLPIRLAGDIDVGNPRYFEEKVKPLLGPDAVYVGPLNDHAKQQFLGNAAVFAMPIDWPEPFGLVVIEALACGTPVVATPFGAMEELIGPDSGIISSESDFAKSLKEAASLDRNAARKRFEEHFTDDRMAEGYEAIYRRLASGEGLPRRP